MANFEIRNMIYENRLRHYEVARILNVSECTLSRWLRTELSPTKKREIIEAIEKLIKK